MMFGCEEDVALDRGEGLTSGCALLTYFKGRGLVVFAHFTSYKE